MWNSQDTYFKYCHKGIGISPYILDPWIKHNYKYMQFTDVTGRATCTIN